MLLALYGIERQNDQSVLNAQLAVIGLTVTYVTASIAVVATDIIQSSPERHWLFAILPAVPTMTFCYLVIFMSDAIYRRGYLDLIEAQLQRAHVQIHDPREHGGLMCVPAWGQISRAVWEPKLINKQQWPLRIAQMYILPGAVLLLLVLIAAVAMRLPDVTLRLVVLGVYAVPLVAVVGALVGMASETKRQRERLALPRQDRYAEGPRIRKSATEHG